jgi:hypothetical protein
VGATLPITEAAQAHRRLVAGEVIGKIVLTMPGTAALPDAALPTHGRP